jgi:WD40 repeat protein/serine/threonine protein kinase
MTEQSNQEDVPGGREDVDPIDRGMAAGFGPASVKVGDRSVLNSLYASLGKVPHVTLRYSVAEPDDPYLKLNSTELPVGEKDGRYQLHGEIARGGMGAIFKGRDSILGRDIAIKVLLDAHRNKREVLERFVEEAQIGGQLQHPGIVPVYELAQFNDDRPFFSMKLVKGKTLATILSEREDPAQDQAKLLGVFEQVCQTMAYAHSRGVIHRDLKPANIMVGAFGEVQVMDWGLAKVLAAGGVADEKKARDKHRDVSIIRTRRTEGSDSSGVGSDTRMGSVMGTPAYMPPEQALGEVDRLDERADVFALGAILCEILTDKPPYVAESSTKVYQQASRGKLDECFARLNSLASDPQLVAIAKRALAAEPEDRFRDAGLMEKAISGYLNAVQERLKRAEIEKTKADARAEEEGRRRKLYFVISALMLFFTLGAIWSAGYFRQQRQVQAQLSEHNKKLAEEEGAARQTAERLATSEANARDEMRRLLYVSDMNLALQQYSDGDFDRVVKLLDRHRPREGEEDLRGFEWYHIWKLCKPGITSPVLRHDEPLFAMAFSPDGKELATASHHWVTIWEVNTQRKVNSFRIDDNFVWDVEYSPDGKSLACAAHHSVKLLDTETGAIETLSPFWSTFVAFSPDGKLLAFHRRIPVTQVPELKLYSLVTKQELVHPLSNKEAKDAAFSPSGNLVATDSSSGMTLWHIKSGKDFRHFEKNDGRISFSRDGQLLAARSNTHIRVWNVDDGEKLIEIEEGNVDTNFDSTVAVSPDKTTLAADGLRNTIKFWDIRTGEQLATLSGHSAELKSLKFSPDGEFLASAAYDGSVRLWTLPIRGQRTILAGHSGNSFSSPTFSMDGSSMAAVSRTGVNIWDTSSWSLRATIPIKAQFAAALSPDGNTIAGIVATKVELWDVKTSQLRLSHEAAGELGRFVAFSPDSERLLFSTRTSVYVWDILAGNPVATPFQIDMGPRKAIFSPDGRFIAIVGEDVQLWDSTSEDGPRRLSGGEQDLYGAAFSPDGKTLATGGSDRIITLWDVETGAERARIPAPVSGLGFSPDGRTLASAAGSLSVRLYDVESAQLRGQLRTESPTRFVAFAPDGKTLLSLLTDGSIQIWHAADEAEVRAAGW